MTFTPKAGRQIIWAATAVSLLAGFAWLWWLCERNPDINFLSKHGDAAWIIYPKPPDPVTFSGLDTAATFRRTFTLEGAPGQATLSVRGFKRFGVSINGVVVTNVTSRASNWKAATEFDVARMLRAGTNEISVVVFNKKAPPALWLSLDTGAQHITSGPEWEVSLLGAAWRNAWPASKPMKFEKGNSLYGGEYTMESLRESLVTLLFFLVVALVLVVGGSKAIAAKKNDSTGLRLMPRFVLVLGILWAALFFNNLGKLPYELGFDEPAHADYIDFIRKNGSLPLANQGWEMCQPPLYYLVGANVASMTGAETNSDRAATALRIIGLVAGVAHFTFVFLTLSLLFPGNAGPQWFGLVLAAFVPELLYVSQYVTNEFLAAALVAGALYFCVRVLKAEKESWKLALAAGLFIGAALLTKFTAILAAPFIAGILILRIHRQLGKSEFRPVVGSFVAFALAAFAVAGWHYIRVWIHFGTPVVHDWDAASGFSWWADKGFQTVQYFTGFGHSLVQPHYSVYHSFGDGIYSTLWGDGLDGGTASFENRPPWNYPLMTAGFLLALLPTAVILIGFFICVVRFFKQPSAEWFLLLGVIVTTYASLMYMSLKLPYCCNVKAFYAMLTLLPMCACGAMGWEALNKLSRKLSMVVSIGMLVWAMNSLATFWIGGGTSFSHTVRGNYLSREGDLRDGVAELKTALGIDSKNTTARLLLATDLAEAGDLAGSREETSKVLADAPEYPDAIMQFALLQAAGGHLDQAIQTTLHLIQVDPDFVLAYEKLSRGLMDMKKYHEASEAAREALRLTPYRAEIHYLLALSLDAAGQTTEANQHFQLASDLKPGWAEARDRLGLTLSELNNPNAAVGEFTEACRLYPDSAEYIQHLAEAQAEAGHFDEAIASLEQAAALARKKGDTKRIELGAKMLERYNSHKPFPEIIQDAVGNPR